MSLVAMNLIIVAVPDRFEVRSPRDLRSVKLTPDGDQLRNGARNYLFATLPSTNSAGRYPKERSCIALLQVQSFEVLVKLGVDHAAVIED